MAKAHQRKNRGKKSPRPRHRFMKAVRHTALTALFGLSAFGCATNSPKAEKITPTGSVMTLPPAPADSTDYQQQLFRHNAADVVTPLENLRLLGMSRDERMAFYMDKLCFTAGGVQTVNGATQRQLLDAMSDLSRMTLLGQPLVELAIANNVKLCSLDKMPAGFAAQYLAIIDAVVAGPQADRAGRAMVLAHEILHAAQDQSGLLTYGYNWDMQSRVTRNLSVEAAAVTGEFLLAFEAKLSGDSTYWNYMTLRRTDAVTLKNLVETTYNAATAAGAAPQEALRDAGRAVWENVFNNTYWRDFYLNEELRAYLGDVEEGRFNGANTTGHYQFGQRKIDKAGAIGDVPSFTQGARFPDYNGLLAGNQKMRWAYEAAEIARRRHMVNGAATVERLRAQALLNGNPYLDLDIVAISRSADTQVFTAGQTFRYLYDHLDDALKNQNPAPAVARLPSERQSPGPA